MPVAMCNEVVTRFSSPKQLSMVMLLLLAMLLLFVMMAAELKLASAVPCLLALWGCDVTRPLSSQEKDDACPPGGPIPYDPGW